MTSIKNWRAIKLLPTDCLIVFDHFAGLVLKGFTHLMSLIFFYTFWKHQKTRGFLIFSGGLGKDQWHEMGWIDQSHVTKFFRGRYLPSGMSATKFFTSSFVLLINMTGKVYLIKFEKQQIYWFNECTELWIE